MKHGMLAVLLLLGKGALAQDGAPAPAPAAAPAAKPIPPEEIDQLVAPIALYPDDVLSQVLMASTYPLEIVQAQRWVKANGKMTDALAPDLEKQGWDPSVKSLVNFPDVLDMMDGKLDWTQKLGNAFLAQQNDVMQAVQRLRDKAWKEGNLKTTKEQAVTVETTTIIIQPVDPKVVYVPVYNPTVVYGTWPYPAYPPYYYYPPHYPRPTLYGFAAGVAVGAAWGYAWGNCSWGHGSCHVDVDVNRNVNINNTSINRSQYSAQMANRGTGTWQHDPQHRAGTPYGDAATAKQYNRGPAADASSRDAYRGRTQTPAQRPAGTTGAGQRPTTSQRPATSQQPKQSTAFSGHGQGSQTRQASSRGASSRQSSSRGGGGGRR